MAVIQRALISVSDKTGIVEFAQQLHQAGVEILSTGGTASLLAEGGVPVIEVSDYTGFPEMMAGRVKTLHPKIHGGILGRRGMDDAVMQEHGIGPIDMVVVNLYPFEQTVAGPDCDIDSCCRQEPRRSHRDCRQWRLRACAGRDGGPGRCGERRHPFPAGGKNLRAYGAL